MHAWTGPAVTSNSVQLLKPSKSVRPSSEGSDDGAIAAPEMAITKVSASRTVPGGNVTRSNSVPIEIVRPVRLLSTGAYRPGAHSWLPGT